MKKEGTKARFCKESTPQKSTPKTLLDYDMQRSAALGYGCHYGDYKADHPNTRAEFEQLTETARRTAPGVTVATCPQCGQQFTKARHQGTKKFCSELCQSRHNNAKHYKKKSDAGKTVACAICGTEFVKKNQHHTYCSKECYTEGQARLHKKQREERKKEATTNGNI